MTLGPPSSTKRNGQEVTVVREKTKKKEYKNVNEEIVDYLENRKNYDFHNDLTMVKYSTGEDKTKYFQTQARSPQPESKNAPKEDSDEEDDDGKWSKLIEKNKANDLFEPPKPQQMNRAGGDDDDIFAKKPAAKSALPPPPKEKRLFGKARKEQQQQGKK